jgi:hypothetical protein
VLVIVHATDVVISTANLNNEQIFKLDNDRKTEDVFRKHNFTTLCEGQLKKRVCRSTANRQYYGKLMLAAKM